MPLLFGGRGHLPSTAQLTCVNHVLPLAGVRVLLEAGRFAVAYLPHVANLGVKTLAGLFAGPRVARFDHDHRARVVELLGRHGEAVPFRSEPHEHVLQDRVRPRKGHAAGLEWMAFCLAPFDAGIHRAEHDGNFAPAESLVQILHQLDITHFGSPLISERAGEFRLPTSRAGLPGPGRCRGPRPPCPWSVAGWTP